MNGILASVQDRTLGKLGMSIFNIPHDMEVRNRCLIVVRLIPVDLRDQTDCSQPPMIEGCGCHPKMGADWSGRSEVNILFDDYGIKEIQMKLTLSPMSTYYVMERCISNCSSFN